MMKTSSHVVEVCRIGQGAETCRYLVMGPSGFECGKTDPSMRALLDGRVEAELIVARGDNCEGKAGVIG